MKKVISAGLSLFLLLTPVAAQEGDSVRSTLKRRTPAAENAGQTGGLEQRLADLSEQISRELGENQKRTIAVVEFVDLKGRVTDFGRFLAEELITRLYQTKKFKVIERQLLNKVVTEQKLSLIGIIDQKSAQQLGRLLGVDAIASGTVTYLGRSLKINARLIDTGTAEVFAVASGEIVKDEAVLKLVGGEDSAAASGEQPTGQPSQQPSSRGQKVEAQFFTFELYRCRLSGSTVACDLTITNNDKDRYLSVCAKSSRVFDNYNNEYRGFRVQLANEEDSFSVKSFLVSGIQTRAKITFERVSPEAAKITLLSIKICHVDGGSDFDLQFRNVLLREQGANETTNETPAGGVAAMASYGQQKTVRVHGNQPWTDTGIDVSPGMRLEVAASGKVYITNRNSVSNVILGDIFKGRNAPRAPLRSVGTSALLAKIRYAKGGESNTLKVGDQNTLIVEEGESGRVYFGIDDRNVSDNSGHFTVKVRW